MKIKNIITVFIISITLFSCGIKDQKEVIPFMKNELKLHKKEMRKINKWINMQNYSKPYYIDVRRAKEDVYICYNVKKGHNLDNEEMTNYIYNFFQVSSFHIIGVYSDVIEYGNKFVNPEHKDYDIVFIVYEPENIKKYKNYKFYETGNIPKETNGWIYHLEGNWYIRSPFAKK